MRFEDFEGDYSAAVPVRVRALGEWWYGEVEFVEDNEATINDEGLIKLNDVGLRAVGKRVEAVVRNGIYFQNEFGIITYIPSHSISSAEFHPDFSNEWRIYVDLCWDVGRNEETRLFSLSAEELAEEKRR